MTAVVLARPGAVRAQPAYASPALLGESADRRVGWMIAVGGVFLVAGASGVGGTQWGGLAAWWEAGAAALVVLTLAAAAFGSVLSTRAVRALSWTFPAISLGLLATWTAARTRPGLGVDTGPWVWQLEPTAVAFAALVLPLGAAVAYSQVSALTVLAAALAFDGHASRQLLVAVLVHLANVMFAVIFAAIRRRLTMLREAEERVAFGITRLSRARADEAERTRLASIVHDEVLATLNVAAQGDGPVSASLAAQALRALTVADGGAGPTSGGRPLPAAGFVSAVRARVAAVDPGVVVDASAGSGAVDTEAADAVLAAVEEAVRNSVRHAAGPGGCRTVARHVDVTIDAAGLRVLVVDDGVGFDPGRVDPRRLGVRRSVLERMAAVPGASARVVSVPGAGTSVELVWRRR